MSSFAQVVAEHFPGTMTEAEFVSRSHTALNRMGFTDDNTIACVAVCRDEITRSLMDQVHEAWGEAFNFASLGGMVFLGKTGFNAAHHHAPVERGRERYVYFGMAHIGIGPDGEIGWCERLGRPGVSTACGALAGVLAELESGHIHTEIDPDDREQSLLKTRILRRLKWGEPPSLLRLTRLAYEIIRHDLHRMVDLTVDTDRADYGCLIGIQIHGRNRQQYVWPGEMFAVVDGERFEIAL